MSKRDRFREQFGEQFGKYIREREKAIEEFRKILAGLDEIDEDLVKVVSYGVCKAVNEATNQSCVFRNEFDEREGDYGQEWVVEFTHGNASPNNEVREDYTIEETEGRGNIPLIVTMFIDTFFEKVNMEIEEENNAIFHMYIKKKMFDPFIVKVGDQIQKVRPVDPEYCGFSIEEQKKQGQYMIRDIDRLQKKIYNDLKEK